MLEKLASNMLAINAIKCNFNCLFFLVLRLDLNKKHDLSWAAKVSMEHFLLKLR